MERRNTIQHELSPRDAAVLLGVRLDYLYRLVWDRTITAKKDREGHWRIPRESLEAYTLTTSDVAQHRKRS